MYHDTQERPTAAGIQRSEQSSHCYDASGNSWRIMSRLTVEIASGKLVWTWTEKPLFLRSESAGKRDRDQKKRCAIVERQKISIKSLSGKLKLPCEMEKRKIRILLFIRSIRSSSPNDYSNNKPIDGHIRLRERENQVVWRIGIEKWALPRKSCKRPPRN